MARLGPFFRYNDCVTPLESESLRRNGNKKVAEEEVAVKYPSGKLLEGGGWYSGDEKVVLDSARWSAGHRSQPGRSQVTGRIAFVGSGQAVDAANRGRRSEGCSRFTGVSTPLELSKRGKKHKAREAMWGL